MHAKFEEIEKMILNAKPSHEVKILSAISNAVVVNEITNEEIVILLDALVYTKKFKN